MSQPQSLPSTNRGTRPPQLPPRNVKPLGSLNAKKVEQVVEPHAQVPDDQQDITTLPINSPAPPPQPQTPRFVAPVPGSTPNNPLQKILQPLLHLLAINPADTPTDALLRKQLEEEQISRYMGSFSRHVQYLRMDGAGAAQQQQQKMEGSGKEVLQRPDKEKYRTRGTPTVPPPPTVLEGIDETPSPNAAHILDEPTSISTADPQEESLGGGGAAAAGAGDIDWFGYYAALAVYYLHLHIPSLRPLTVQAPTSLARAGGKAEETGKERERERFTISRLRSSVERLYVDARSPWETLVVWVGEVVMWRDVGMTVKWLLVYVLLTVTNTFTPFLLSVPLYHLIRERLFPPSVAQLREKEREASERLKEGHELASDIVQPTPSISSTYIPTMMTLPGGLGGEFATEAAMRGFGYARDSMATYAFGNAAGGGGAAGLEQAPEDAVNEDILRPHVKRFVSGVMGQGQTASPIAAGSASITELDPTQGPTSTPTTAAGAAEEGVDQALPGKKGKGKEKKKEKEKGKPAAGKSKTSKLRDKWEEFKVVHGTGLIVVLDDLADIHERVESLFAWRRPESSVKFAMILILAILGTHLVPAFWMLKLFQVAIGVVLFIVIPVAARMERYEPISASMTAAPTMAEHVINVMRDRAARGEPLPEFRPPVKTPSRKDTAMSTSGSITTSDHASTTSLPLTSTEIQEEVVRIDNTSDTESISSATATGAAKRKVDWGAMRDQAVAHAHTGTQWWQTGKELWKGEKKVQFSWKGSSEDWENIENSALAARQVSLGAKGPGIHLSVHSTGEASPYIKEGISYLARHAGYTGQLYLSSEGLMFVPMIGSAADTEKTPQSAIAADEHAQQTEQEGKKAPERQRPEVQVPMSAIVGMRKSNKTAMGVVVSAGLQIDVADGSSIVFSFVANRDVVFNRLLALSRGTFRRI